MKNPPLFSWGVALLAGSLMVACEKQPASPAPEATKPATGAVSAASPLPTANAAFASLPGKWVRSDGGYMIEIRGVDASGKLDAGYFNPSPINVNRAQATQEGSVTQVFIELRDVNYPGSTYKLALDPANGQLRGVYFQAVTQETYEVSFAKQQ